MVLTGILLFAAHVDGGDTEKSTLSGRDSDLSSAILLPIKFCHNDWFGISERHQSMRLTCLRDPTFLQALLDIPAKIFIEWIARPIFRVEPVF